MQEITEEEAKEYETPSIKERYVLAAGREVPLDYFLYCCLEEERTRKDLESSGDGWERLQGLSKDHTPKEVLKGSLADQVRECAKWYATNAPQLTDHEPLDYERHAAVVPRFVAMIEDLDLLIRARGNGHVPCRPLLGNKPDQMWLMVDEVIDTTFPGYSHLMLEFLQWAFGEESRVEYDPGSLPPVGRYAAMLRARNKKRVPRNHKKPSPQQSGGRRHQGSASGVPRRRDEQSPNRNSNPKRSNQSHENRAPRPQQQSENLDAPTMKELERGMDVLKQDTGLEHYTLKPQNSFVRRLQHKKIVSAGFGSASVGTGQTRSVRIVRKKLRGQNKNTDTKPKETSE
ncbi:MAG: hypothetical protein AB8C84_04015 [Oligoflexales bacterium]